ncbi:unnamed protein product [Penicillium olsonii]|nr:unnamed protein product [Penicillium olsonii]CAG7934228.1 unnamed protein product [Penicillium olsonii]
MDNIATPTGLYWSDIYHRFLPIPKRISIFGVFPMEPEKPIVSEKATDSGLHAQLHPLVVITVSDQIGRHFARNQRSPLVGALMGQQNGQEITLENVFECPVTIDAGGRIKLPAAWFEERLQQFKDVHKSPALELVGWWAVTPSTGPTDAHLNLHRQVLQDYNPSAVFLAYHNTHPGSFLAGGRDPKLPVTIYETVYEGENSADADKNLQLDGEGIPLKFREIPFTVETGEAEMIGIDTIAQHSGTASLAETQEQASAKMENQSVEGELSQEEVEIVASLQTRINATRVLQSRVDSMTEKLESDEQNTSPQDKESGKRTPSDHSRREINAILSQASLLTPSEDSTFQQEIVSQSNDVQLISLLGKLGEGTQAMRELGRKTATIQAGQQTAASRQDPRSNMQRANPDFFGQGEQGGPDAGMRQ